MSFASGSEDPADPLNELISLERRGKVAIQLLAPVRFKGSANAVQAVADILVRAIGMKHDKPALIWYSIQKCLKLAHHSEIVASLHENALVRRLGNVRNRKIL